MVTDARSISDRMLGALRLDVGTYEEVEKDKTATGQAAFIVVASSFVAAAGNALLRGGEANAGFTVAIVELVGWALYAWIAFFVGTKIIPGKDTKSDWGEVARTLGFANTPRFLLIFVALPGFTGLVRSVVSLWILVATVVALQSALDVSTGRAVAVGLISWLAQLVLIVAFVSFA